MRVFHSVEEVVAARGTDLGISEWLPITQERVDQFAETTGDRQWIHVDPDAATQGPYGGTIAHGFLTLSLIPLLGAQVFRFGFDNARVNYGLNKVRFPSAVPVGRQVRASVRIDDVAATAVGHQVTFTYVIEVEGSAKPACVAELLVLLMA